ncbi:MAG: RDD family protein [Campylobacteraceae bacterium]|nr:RDD family protein [Campylobacteraceae bacterium]
MVKRWREVKQKKPKNSSQKESEHKNAFVAQRIKAFLIDMFMINMPLLYFTTYVVLGSKEAFQQSSIAIFVCTVIFGLILSIFFSIKGQTPGYKAYEIKLIDDKTEKKPTFFRAFFRYFCFILAFVTLFGVLMMFFRKDSRNLHDILSKTRIVKNQI